MKKLLSFAPLVFLTISLGPSLNAQPTWNSAEEFRTEYVRLLDSLSQHVPSSDESTWAVALRQKISDLKQQVNGLSYPALDRFSKLTDRQTFTKMIDGVTAADSVAKNDKSAGRQAAIVPPNYSSAVAGTTCSTSPTSAGVIDGEKIGLYVDRGLAVLAQTVCDAAPDVLGEGTNTIPCGLAGVANGVEVVLDSLIDHQEFCNGLLGDADHAAILADVINVHDDLTNDNNQITNEFIGTNTNITNGFNTTNTHLTTVNNQITTEFTALDTHLTNVDNRVAVEFNALDAHIVALVSQLTTQIAQGTALLAADLKQVMKLELTPEGKRVINPAILTCSGTNCPNVLAACPAAGCSWNNAGPLP